MTPRVRFAVVAVIAAVIVGIALVVATANRMPGDDVATLALIAGGAAAASGVIGALVQRLVRHRSVAHQALVVALTPPVATAVGAVFAARAMFVSHHDLVALLVVVSASGGVGAIVGLGLAERLGDAARSLTSLATQIDGATSVRADRPPTRELADLADQLAATSARLAEATARERALERSRRELVAWVSHDLRTPLAGIRAMVEALEDGLVDPEDVGRYHRTLGVEADRLAGLVDDLFELSRIESSTLQLTFERVRLDDVVSDALASAQPVAAAKGVRLAGTVHEPAPVVEVAPAELNRVMRNLLDNAIRHTPTDGAVVVETGADDDAAFISVLDSCGGIPSDEIDRVFDLAFRGDPARTPGERGGGGLGLAIARGFVEAHHGEIDVLNEAGGCRFTVRLPLP